MTLDVAELMAAAYSVAVHSPDHSNQNGAIVLDGTGEVVATGWNDYPNGFVLSDEDAADRDLRLSHIEHAERAAIYDAAATGQRLHTMICPWAPCMECGRAIVLSGIERLIVHTERMNLTPSRWIEEVGRALDLVGRTVEVLRCEGPIPVDAVVQVNGRPWSPRTLEFVEV